MAEENKWKPNDGGENEEDEELDETAYKSAKDAVLFAIEVSPSMLIVPSPTDSKKPDTNTPVSAALKCAFALMQQRIISNPNDMMGILLYGTEKTRFQGEEQTPGGLAYPHCYLLIDLDIPAAGDVKALKTLVEDEEEFKKLVVPSEEPVSMANVLFCANQIFTTKAPNFTSRRLFIVTNDDDPHSKEKTMKSAAAVRAKDLYDLGVIIELFPISKPNHEFDREVFYNDIIYNASPADPEAPAPVSGAVKTSSTKDGISLLTSLLSSVNSKAVARRALFSNLPFEIGPGFKISVKGYIIFKRQEPQRSCYVWLNGEKAQIAKGISSQTADDTARAVEKVEIKKAFKFGGDQITFTPEEIASLRNFGDPGIRIIGFKPMSMLPIWASFRPSTFIYPSEDDYVGSTRVFSALQQKLLKDQKMGLAWFVARKNASPVIAAIVPGAEKLDDAGAQVMPPGMWLIPLPFADDIRQDPETTLIRAPEPLIDLMRLVIQQLQLPKAQYDPSKYSNPALQWHYRILQAMALEEDLPEKPEDNTIPRYKQIDKRAGAYVIDWGIELESQYQAWQSSSHPKPTAIKRPPSEQADGTTGAKRIKKSASVDVMSDADMKKAFDKNSVGKVRCSFYTSRPKNQQKNRDKSRYQELTRTQSTQLTLAELKPWLESKGIHTHAKKKADLVESVEAFFERK
ncbi:ATP-dependent DNA helicase II subunit 1 [Toensbergia leucococca]|nr:ATP-dependent DNA helicase II subunit 1 [Toensbergia leucococca]